jgi:amino-acid N-acetyltransferase
MIIRPARPADLPSILRLVNEHAQRGEVLPRSAMSIRDTLNDWLVGEDEAGNIMACVSLFYYSALLAEVRSLVVHDEAKGNGWGRSIVKTLMSQARRRQVPTLFALTRAVPFFQRLGFAVTAMDQFPEKVFRDCLICPVRNNCDEIAVVLNLGDSAEP